MTGPLNIENLTPKEKEVIGHLLQGKTNFEIGVEMFIYEGAVKWHLTNIYRKLGLKGRYDLITGLLNHERRATPDVEKPL